MSPPPAKVILQTSQVPTALLSQGAKKTAPAVGPQCACRRSRPGPSKISPQAGRGTRSTQHVGEGEDGGGEDGGGEDGGDGPADGPSATWTSKQAQLAAG